MKGKNRGILVTTSVLPPGRETQAEEDTYPQCQPKLHTQTGKAAERRHKASQHPNYKKKKGIRSHSQTSKKRNICYFTNQKIVFTIPQNKPE